jgi:hypothetical protein
MLVGEFTEIAAFKLIVGALEDRKWDKEERNSSEAYLVKTAFPKYLPRPKSVLSSSSSSSSAGI